MREYIVGEKVSIDVKGSQFIEHLTDQWLNSEDTYKSR
jgi:hypothetical protein